eukprot:SM000005S17142  [mRNA]  locus=s5:341517:342152:- [translate_table: standard]
MESASPTKARIKYCLSSQTSRASNNIGGILILGVTSLWPYMTVVLVEQTPSQLQHIRDLEGTVLLSSTWQADLCQSATIKV